MFCFCCTAQWVSYSYTHIHSLLDSFSIWSFWASLLAQMVKNLPAMQETLVQTLGWEDPWGREYLPILVFLPGEFHGQRSHLLSHKKE